MAIANKCLQSVRMCAAGKYHRYVEFVVNYIVKMQSSSFLYSMSLTLSIFKVTRRLLQLQNDTKCMVDHPGLEPVCLNVFSLQNALNIYRADYGPLRQAGIQR